MSKAARVEFTSPAARHLRVLPMDVQRRIAKAVDKLAMGKAPADHPNRIQVGDYRVLYVQEDGVFLVVGVVNR